jgi:hypothetical protein
MPYDFAAKPSKAKEDSPAPLDIERACALYENFLDATSEARNNAEVCRDYRDHKQWTAAEKAALAVRGQPVLTNNRIAPKIDYLLGAERQGRTDPKAFPRNPEDQGSSEAATDALRYICDRAKFSETRSEVFENVLVEGYGGAIVESVKKRGQYEVEITRIPWDRLFYDPHSRRRDFNDARYKGVVTWMDLEEAQEKWPESKAELTDCCIHTGTLDQEDKPTIWSDPKRKRVKVLEMYWHGKDWMRCVFTRGVWLEKLEKSPYEDEYGDPVCPIEMVAAFIDRENARYSPTLRYISIQDAINKRESKLLHLVSVRQVRINRGAVDDIANVRKELAKPDGVVEVNTKEDFDIIPTGDMAEGQMLLLQQGLQSLDAVGANAALQGKQEGGQSGRAIQARQQGGQVELGPLFDGLRQWSTRIYEQCWMRAKQHWKEPMWIRVTDDERKLRYVGLNQKTTVGEQIVEKAKQQKLPPEQMQMLVQQIAQDPRAQLPATNNDISKLDVDIVIDSSPDVVTLQGEQFEMIAELYKANPRGPQNPEGIPFELVVQTSSLRDKDKVLEMMKGGGEPTPEQAQAQQMQQQFQQAMAMADLALKQADADLKKAQAQKAMREAMVMQPEQQQAPQVPDAFVKAQAQVESARITSETKAATEIQTAQMEQDGQNARALLQAQVDRYAVDANEAKEREAAVVKLQALIKSAQTQKGPAPK